MKAVGVSGIGALASGTIASAAEPSIVVNGGGYDIWNDYDEFHYYYDELEGDFDVTVRVDELENTDEYAKAGLMVRQSLADDDEHAMIRRTAGNGTSFQWRSDGGDDAESTTSDSGEEVSGVAGGTIAADWQRLVREGETIRAYGSNDGENWTLIAEISPSVGTIDFADSAYVGLAVTSHNEGTLCSATFSNLEGLSPSENTDVGDVEIAGSVSTDETNPGNGGDTDLVVSTGSASDVTVSSARLTGAVDDFGGADEGTVSFEYRASDGSWTATPSQTLSETGTFSYQIDGLAAGTSYEFRAVAEVGDVDTATGAVTTFATEEGTGDGSGGSFFDLDDGFATPAPWLDDDVDVYRVQEATRSAVEGPLQASGPRVVVFETSGTIDLGGDRLQVTEDQCWIAGQTAPSPGITFINGMLQVAANDCVVQHVRSRIGPGADGDIQGNDSFNTADETRNNVVDHVTAAWGTDECMSVGYDTNRSTYTNNLIYEGLYDPYGDESDHNYGTLVGDGASNVTLAGNVWAKVRGRVPRLKSDTESVVVNNLAYFYDYAADADGSTVTSFVGNVYAGLLDTGDAPLEGGSAYHDDNVTADPPLDDDQPFAETDSLSSRPLWPDALETMSSSGVESHNLQYAGARPADRTANDERIVQEITDRAGNDRLDSPYDYWLGHPDEIGGYPDLPENTHSLSVPDSGLRQWLEDWALAVEEPGASPP